MITKKELNPKGHKLSDEVQRNLDVLHDRINQIRSLWGKPMIVTSGVRSLEHHLDVYQRKALRKEAPYQDGKFDSAKVPMGSKHLSGEAVDIGDPDGSLCAWLKLHPLILKGSELWCEEGTKGWVHFQTCPPKSGKRWFLP